MEQQDLEIHFSIIAQSIERQDYDTLQIYLEESPFGEMERQISDTYLLYLLVLCYNGRDVKSVNMVIESWEQSNPSEELTPIRTYIFTIPGLHIVVAQFVANADERGSYLRYMMRLVYFASSSSITMACDLLFRIYGEQPSHVYGELLNEMEEHKGEDESMNMAAHEYIKELYRLTSEHAAVPAWVNVGYYQELPTHEELVATLKAPQAPAIFELPSDYDIVDMITNVAEDLPGIVIDDQDELRDQIKSAIMNMSPAEKIETVRNLYKSKMEYDLHSNSEIFRVFGPAHPLTDQELGNEIGEEGEGDAPCGQWGGCRMHLCIEFENFDEDGEVYDEMISITRRYADIDWFTGACDFCDKRIRQKHHAVRMPLDEGGWLGCYCSWEHVKLDVPLPNDLRLEMITTFEKQFIEYGIQDRVYEIAEEKEEWCITEEAIHIGIREILDDEFKAGIAGGVELIQEIIVKKGEEEV